eukprot:NODE_11263_length_466_cov_48.094395_g11240_i0.p1 GENE.NODE_11263_length_466_cov_48.094395_g11240_i0~~NODE_11263_length_466_cov_48.094395_g11240_i0.p1  ORF type:complete len:100 (+),score=21.91 NODE_11263_length_466_cov_48.094395_g11240_i0:65-364(+)
METQTEPLPEDDMSARICKVDMGEDMTQDAVDCAAEALRNYKAQKDMAQFIKKEFDAKYNAKWHVIVGKHFGSYVSYEPDAFVYFFIGDLAFLIFKAND